MKRKVFITGGVIIGLLILIIILLWAATPLFVKMGIDPVCIQGEFPDIRIVPCPEGVTSQATVTPLPIQGGSEGLLIPVVVDDDGSPDGIIALLYFLRHPNYEVKAVTISQGEAHPSLFAEHIEKLLSFVGRADIPIGVGRELPLEGDNEFPEPWREVSDDFWGFSLPEVTRKAETYPAAELIAKVASEASQPLLVFISGPHTNLAEALRLDPSIVKSIGGVYIMGGSIYVPGNIESDWPEISNRVAEWNIWTDPVAAEEVFSSSLPLHLVPLDGTNQVIWTDIEAREWAESKTQEGVMAGKVMQWMLDSWSPEGVYIWDLVAAVTATDRRVCREVPLALGVNTTPGPKQGQTYIIDGPENINVCLEPDVGQVKALSAYVFIQQ